jgi:hypothetical protein
MPGGKNVMENKGSTVRSARSVNYERRGREWPGGVIDGGGGEEKKRGRGVTKPGEDDDDDDNNEKGKRGNKKVNVDHVGWRDGARM